MIDLVVLVCLISAPDYCIERRIPAPHGTGIVGCMTGLAPMLAQLVAADPSWQVKRWRCEMARPGDARA
jgi:hypothetical protein